MIIAPMPASRSESWETQVNNASIRYSDNANLQAAFRDGVKWQVGDGPSGWSVLIFIMIAIWVMIQLVAFVGGLAGADTNSGECKNRWVYVTPAYNVGYSLGRFLKEEN